MATSSFTRRPRPRHARLRRAVARLAALASLIVTGAAVYLVSAGIGPATRAASGPDVPELGIHPIAEFGSGYGEDLAVGASGRVAVAFLRPTPTGVQTLARLGTVRGGFGPLKRLARRSAAPPRIAVGEDGLAAALWVQGTADGGKRLQVALATPGLRFGTPRTLDRTDGEMTARSVAVQTNGRVVATWRRDDDVRTVLRENGRFGASSPVARGAGTERRSPPLSPRADRAVRRLAARGDVTRIVRTATVGDHVVVAWRASAARRGHLLIAAVR